MTKEELIKYLNTKKNFILAIDGMCGSGKSSLAKELQILFDANVFHMDDFYLPIEKRTSERLNQPGGNVEYERFLETVLIPLSKGEDVYYQRFDCTKMSLTEKEIIKYKPMNIVEGSYSLRPELVDYYSDIIVLKISNELQIQRLTKRNPTKIDMFINKWIPLENKYFEYYHIMDEYPTMQ
ncbi:MAG: hypothetical protein U0L85_07585 [Bacilli bacterium]|nr:hypothetical protein [Bacilli bacterium]